MRQYTVDVAPNMGHRELDMGPAIMRTCGWSFHLHDDAKIFHWHRRSWSPRISIKETGRGVLVRTHLLKVELYNFTDNSWEVRISHEGEHAVHKWDKSLPFEWEIDAGYCTYYVRAVFHHSPIVAIYAIG